MPTTTEGHLAEIVTRLEELKGQVDKLKPESKIWKSFGLAFPMLTALFAVWLGSTLTGRDRAAELSVEKLIDSVVVVRNEADKTFNFLDSYYTTIYRKPDYRESNYDGQALTSGENLRRAIVSGAFQSETREKMIQIHEALVEHYLDLQRATTDEERKTVAAAARLDVQEKQAEFVKMIDELLP